VAVVGSRRATAQGLDNARAFAAALSQQGLVVFSGLALGVDAAAHEGALTGPAGTVAVVGTGLDGVYPPRHQPLAERIAAHGALVSEYAPGMPPLAENFPQRNRIIAGLSLGTLVVEAALQSGSLITARLAVEACREVFAIPGSIHAPQSKGCHALIKQGAKLVETAQDIVEELRLAGPAQASPAAGRTARGRPAAAGTGTRPGDHRRTGGPHRLAGGRTGRAPARTGARRPRGTPARRALPAAAGKRLKACRAPQGLAPASDPAHPAKPPQEARV
jgi:DNA processing protein